MINKDNLHFFAADNYELIDGEVRGLVMEFPGLDGGSCLGGQTHVGPLKSGYAVRCARRGLLLVYPFVGPWSWMNDVAVKTTDMVIDAVKEKYALGDVPMVNTGGSMGGAGALIAKCIHTAEVIAFEDLGCESVKRMTVQDFALTVAIDSRGGDLYQSGKAAYAAADERL